jgi:hypothetical protein
MQFLILAKLTSGFLDKGLPANFAQILEEETAHAKTGYLKGSLRQIWLQQPGPGAVAIIEADSLEAAEKVAAGFPLAQAGLLEAQVIALAPYTGFGEN